MTNQNDPVSQIKAAEEKAHKKIEKASQEIETKLREFEDLLIKKTLTFEDARREKGNEELEGVKKEAGETLKAKIDATEGEKSKLKKTASEKQNNGVKLIMQSFESYINR